MDNAFLGPIISALGRSFQSKRNRGKSTGKKEYPSDGFSSFGCIRILGCFSCGISVISVFLFPF